METIIGAEGAGSKRRPDMTDFTHKRAFMDGVKTGREQNSAERKILLERINKLEEQLEQQLQQAHREGWEQCKFEAMTKSTGRSYDAIAALEYKEPAK